jgi:hypothetical protein
MRVPATRSKVILILIPLLAGQALLLNLVILMVSVLSHDHRVTAQFDAGRLRAVAVHDDSHEHDDPHATSGSSEDHRLPLEIEAGLEKARLRSQSVAPLPIPVSRLVHCNVVLDGFFRAQPTLSFSRSSEDLPPPEALELLSLRI